MFQDVTTELWKFIVGFFEGIINAFINNPEVTILVIAGIILTIIFKR